ncbi:Ribosome hibernation promoting factor [Paraburkholderia ultramafica]|uniref:Ribosome hibernation promoting factor n=1 Tax=Paraburkholderia ultramafica TaxID=1544867 RepID=A0A6S7C7Q7_9BURK|nr:Ribosome hibernation promoting factor [Paraburkholderia ultramafica]
MNLKISGHHLEVTTAMREYVVTKLERVLRHFEHVIDVTVLLSVDNHKQKGQRAEVNVHVKGRDIFVESSNGNLYAAIDLLVDKLDRQVVRYKNRLQDHHHDGIKYRSANMTPAGCSYEELSGISCGEVGIKRSHRMGQVNRFPDGIAN